MPTIKSEADRPDGGNVDLIAADAVRVDFTRGAGRENDRG